MNQNANTLCGAQQESPITRANQRVIKALDETSTLISELRARISVVLRPDQPTPCDPSVGCKAAARDMAAPLTDGTNDRACQVEGLNAELRNILSRIEL